MTERKKRKRRPAPSSAAAAVARTRESDEAERTLGRGVALGMPLVFGAAAIGIGAFVGLGSGLLVLAAGALLGTIALLWTSVRTLSGDAPLPGDMEAIAAQAHGTDALAEKKQRVLRALKDLESEHALGKIDDADYAAFTSRYREEAKEVMREMDLQVAPAREEAERLAREHLARKGLGQEPPTDEAPTDEAPAAARPERAACAGCGTSNEADAAFCKKCGAAMKKAPEAQDARP
jgi:hypothetical protein